MDIITIDYIKYIDGSDLINKALEYSKHCRSSRNLITKHDINNNNYIFAKFKNGCWKISDGKSVKMDRVLLKYDYLLTIPEINDILDNDKIIENLPDEYEIINDELLNNITVRRDLNNKVYFDCCEISKLLNDVDLETTILNNNLYNYNDDYKYFKTASNKKELFLTYQGMLRVLFASHSKQVKHFVKWATETLFTVQMGEDEDKDTLAACLLGTTYNVVKQAFRSGVRTTPCIYLLIVKEEDDKLICKFGFTKDLVRRMREHKSLFKKEFNKEPTLLYYGIIDIMFMSEAETNLGCYFKNYKYNYKNFDELVIIDKSELKQIKMIYESMENKYIGRYEEMKNQINEFKLEIVNINKNIELLKEKHVMELYKKDMEIRLLKDKYLIDSQQKDIDILKKEVELVRNYKNN